MSPSLEFLERCSTDTGFAIPALEKVVRLGELASAIGRHALRQARRPLQPFPSMAS